jgi:hypothetical protein
MSWVNFILLKELFTLASPQIPIFAASKFTEHIGKVRGIEKSRSRPRLCGYGRFLPGG